MVNINPNFNEIILHCSSTTEDQDFDVEDIRKWHMSPPNNWSDIGYYFVIKLDGTIQKGRPISKVGSHTYGRNKNSIGICYVGGLDVNSKVKDSRTAAQKSSIEKLIIDLVSENPQLKKLSGHNDYNPDITDPSFKVADKYGYLQEKGIIKVNGVK